MRQKYFFLLLAVPAFLLLSCGGGGSGSTTPLAVLSGTWFGLYPDGENYAFVMDGAGALTEVRVDSVVTGITGSITALGPGAFRVSQSDGRQATLITDAGVAHGVYIVEDLALTLEKDPVNPGSVTFTYGEVFDGWSGYGFAQTNAVIGFDRFEPVTVATSTSPDRFTVTMPTATITGTIDSFDAGYGLWTGTADVTGAAVIIILSLDKQFVGVEVTPAGSPPWADYVYFALGRDP